MVAKVLKREELVKILISKGNGGYIDYLSKNIRYFQSFDLQESHYEHTKLYNETLRFITLFDDTEIIGIAKIAVYENSNKYVSLPYLSVHKDYQGKGFSKLLTDCMFKYINTVINDHRSSYFGKMFSTTEYTPSGYKTLRNQFLKYTDLYNITFRDAKVGFPDYDFEIMDNKPMDAEYFKLYEESKKNLPKELEYV